MKILIFCLTIFACGFSQPISAALKTGDPAPKIRVASWAQGPGVKEIESGKVYIIEF